MPGRIDLMLTPHILEQELVISHRNELVLLDKAPYCGDLPIKDYGLDRKFLEGRKTEVPAPRANTYVLNLVDLAVRDGRFTLSTNYSTMRSQFALRTWIPELS